MRYFCSYVTQIKMYERLKSIGQMKSYLSHLSLNSQVSSSSKAPSTSRSTDVHRHRVTKGKLYFLYIYFLDLLLLNLNMCVMKPKTRLALIMTMFTSIGILHVTFLIFLFAGRDILYPVIV